MVARGRQRLWKGFTMSKSDAKTKVPYWRELESNGRKKREGKYGIDLGERGIYDKRNKLNELTGKEWIYFTNSVWITAFPPVAGKDSGFDLRKIHPSPKPPELIKEIVCFFTKSNQWILDPFAGVGGTLIGASLCEPARNAVGIELNKDYVNAYKKVNSNLKLKKQEMICSDARNISRHKKIKERIFDLILTDPPYSDMMARNKNGQKKKLYGKNDASKFTFDDRDIGNLNRKDFLEELKSIISLALKYLKDKGYLVIFCKDFQPTDDSPNLLHNDVINKLIEIPCLRYRGLRIWHDQAMDLYPFGYPYAFVMNQLHQYILIFRKELLT